MGKGLIDFWQTKVSKQAKFAFFTTVIVGLLIHIYKFVNTLPHTDSVYSYYSSNNVVGSGRWFLSVASGISSFFDLPWVTGLLSLIWIALSVVIIVNLFQIDNPIVIMICSGLIVAFPGLTETFLYQYTADGYMLAMLLATLSVWFSTFERKKIGWTLLSILLLCLSLGIYQTYASFAFVLMLCYFIYDVLENKHTTKEYMNYILKQIIIFILAMVLYFIIWQICMQVQGVSANEYLGIDQVSNLSFFKDSPLKVFSRIYYLLINFALFFIEGNPFKHGFTLYGLLNTIFLIFMVGGMVLAFIKSKIYKSPVRTMLMALAVVLIVPGLLALGLLSDKMTYRAMMLYGVCILYVFVAILYDRYAKVRLSTVVAILLSLIVFNNALIANITYFHLNQSYENSYATALEISFRLHEYDRESYDQVAVVGNNNLKLESDIYPKRVMMVSKLITLDLICYSIPTERFLNHILKEDLSFVNDDELKQYTEMQQVKDMDVWPAQGSMQIIEDTLVIKLSD